MQSSVIGGAMLPHAPQFFTMPETEDRATVERVEAVAREIGGRLKALKPDLWLIFANDHAEQFFHNVAPPFTVHVGASASGNFAGRNFHWKVPGEIGFEIVKGLYRQGTSGNLRLCAEGAVGRGLRGCPAHPSAQRLLARVATPASLPLMLE